MNAPSRTTATNTTTVDSLSSRRVGQVAFFNSRMVSPQKIRILRNGFFINFYLAGQEGLEPPTDGFGDRNSTN